jgi:hypothetical protein
MLYYIALRSVERFVQMPPKGSSTRPPLTRDGVKAILATAAPDISLLPEGEPLIERAALDPVLTVPSFGFILNAQKLL